MSVLNVTSDHLYDSFPNTVEDGALSRRLGLSMKASELGEAIYCHTCGLPHPQCLGHFGHIDLALPIFHPAYITQIQEILQQCCWHCGCCREPESSICPNCNQQKQIANLQLTPTTVKTIFNLIPSNQKPLLCYQHPENLIISCIPVPPACIRPTIYDKQTDDDLTRLICRIIQNNQFLKEAMKNGKQSSVSYCWNGVQASAAELIGVKFNYNVENLQIKRQDQQDLTEQEQQQTQQQQVQVSNNNDKKGELTSIISRLSGKYGRFRANLSGKRVNFTGRSVISPDINLKVGELGVPYLVGRLLTIKLEVNEQNIGYIQNLLNSDQIALIEKRSEQQSVVQRNELFLSKQDVRKQMYNNQLDEDDWVHYQWVGTSMIEDKNYTFNRVEPDEQSRKIEARGRYRQTRLNNLKWFSSLQSKEYQEEKQIDTQNTQEVNKQQVYKQILQEQITPQYPREQQQQTYNYLKIPSNTLLQQQRNINIQSGDVVHRFLQDGDVILFNRQPSLHKTSIQQFKVKLHNFKSFKFNVMCCKNLNADFDGDESNIQLPQGVQVQAEAAHLMKHEDNLIDIANKTISYNVMQDAISGLYILTREATLTFDQYQLLLLVNQQSLGDDGQYLGSNVKSVSSQSIERYEKLNDVMEELNLKPFKYSNIIEQPAILYPKPVYTGKQLISKIIQTHTQECPVQFTSGNVKIQNGEIMSGVMTGKILQSMLQSICENNILYTDEKTQLETRVFNLMYSLQRTIIRYIQNKGFSLGMGDIWPSNNLEQVKLQDTEECFKNFGYNNINEVEYSWHYNFENKSKHFQPIPKQYIEKIHQKQDEINKMIVLSDLRTKLSEQLVDSIQGNPYNSSLQIMVSSGAKGSSVNQIQMTGILAMQNVSDQMINACFGDRVLPHFIGSSKYNVFNPYENGFVQNSYFNGLTPYEFITHTTAGRVGVIDSSVKTAQTGYIQRKLLKNLESCTVDYLQNVECNNKIIKYKNEQKLLTNDIYNITFEQYCRQQLQYLLNIQSISLQKCEEKQDNINEAIEIVEQYTKQQSQQIRDTLIQVCNEMDQAQLNNLIQQAKDRFILYVKQCIKQLNKASRWLEPATPIGTLVGQSVGEPTTQMTLKSFHFTGLQSKIQGFPRLIQLYNAVKKADCNMCIYLSIENKDMMYHKKKDNDIEVYATKGIKFERNELDRQKQAIYIKNQFEPLYLNQISTIETITTNEKYSINVVLDTDKLNELMVDITLNEDLLQQILKQIKCYKIQECDAQLLSNKSFQITLSDVKSEEQIMYMNQVAYQLSNARIHGIKDVQCDIQEISVQELQQSEYYRLYLQNNKNLQNQCKTSLTHDYMLYSSTPQNIFQILNNKFVDQYLSYTTDIFQTYQVFGIEAAKYLIAKQIHQLYTDYGFNIQYYHCELIASFMCQTGRILGYTNQGIKQTKANKTILLASFERTGEYLLEAGLKELKEKLTDVSEDIIFGNNIKVGSGYSEILFQPNYK